MKKRLLTLIVLALMLGINHPAEAQGPIALKKEPYEEFVSKFKKRPLSPDAFKEALLIAGLPEKHIEHIYKHARSESGNFKSRIFREQNNAFGMRLPRRRQTTAIGKNRGYAIYKDWYDSVYDYWLWYKHKPIQREQSWGSYLRSRNYMNPKDKKKS